MVNWCKVKLGERIQRRQTQDHVLSVSNEEINIESMGESALKSYIKGEKQKKNAGTGYRLTCEVNR